MSTPLGELLVLLVSTTLAGLTGWVLSDLRRRTLKLESKTQAVIVALFYLIMHDPKIPLEAKESVQKAMGL